MLFVLVGALPQMVPQAGDTQRVMTALPSAMLSLPLWFADDGGTTAAAAAAVEWALFVTAISATAALTTWSASMSGSHLSAVTTSAVVVALMTMCA
jgi:hypothetical protein